MVKHAFSLVNPHKIFLITFFYFTYLEMNSRSSRRRRSVISPRIEAKLTGWPVPWSSLLYYLRIGKSNIILFLVMWDPPHLLWTFLDVKQRLHNHIRNLFQHFQVNSIWSHGSECIPNLLLSHFCDQISSMKIEAKKAWSSLAFSTLSTTSFSPLFRSRSASSLNFLFLCVA